MGIVRPLTVGILHSNFNQIPFKWLWNCIIHCALSLKYSSRRCRRPLTNFGISLSAHLSQLWTFKHFSFGWFVKIYGRKTGVAEV